MSKAGGDRLLDRELTVAVTGLTAHSHRVRHRRLDADHSDLNAAWDQLGGGRDWPEGDEWDQLAAGNQLEDLVAPADHDVVDGVLELRFTLPMPAVSLIELTPTSR